MHLKIFSRAKEKISYLSSSRVSFRKPPNKRVAILDSSGSTEILTYLPQSETQVIDLDRGEVNLWVLVHAIFRFRFDLFGYLLSYLELVKPSVCITMIDTTPFIYRLKDRFPEVVTISIQNGWRALETKRDLENQSSRLQIDHLLCFGEASRQLYSASISGTFHLVGSFRSNMVPVANEPSSRSIALISTLRSKVDLSGTVPGYGGPTGISYEQIFDRRLTLAQYVAEFCEMNSLSLMVLGKEQNDARERELYVSALSDFKINWEFRPRTDLLSNYWNLNQARIAVSTSSSLGYEALSRGIRTAFFMLDPEVTGNFGDRFGWPEPLDDAGEIWANFLDRTKTHEVLSRLHGMSDDEWIELRRRFVPRMISSDPGNMTFRALVQQSLANR